MQTDASGHGVINILAADKLLQNPKAYATLLLWLLSELFEQLPRSRRSGQAEAGVLLRRSASCCSAMRRRSLSAKNRTGGAAGPLQGGGRLLRDAKSARYSGHHSRAIRQPRAARAARVHSARPESGEERGHDVARQSEASMPKKPSPNWRWAKHSSRLWMRKAGPTWFSGPSSYRRPAASDPRHRRKSAQA